MKTVTKVFLWIYLVAAIIMLVVGAIGTITVVTYYDQLKHSQGENELSMMISIFVVLLVVGIAVTAFQVIALQRLNEATKKSDLPLWLKIFAFLLSNLVVAVLLLLLDDEALAPEGGVPVETTSKVNALDELMKYKKMLDEGLISDDEYLAKKATLLK